MRLYRENLAFFICGFIASDSKNKPLEVTLAILGSYHKDGVVVVGKLDFNIVFCQVRGDFSILKNDFQRFALAKPDAKRC